MRGRAVEHQRAGDARPRVHDRQAAATFRIAFVGDSIGAGWGVNDGEGFEPLLEQSSTRGRERGRAGRSRSSTSPCRGTGPASAGTTSRGSAGATAPDLVDLRIDPGRRGLGRAPAPRPAAPRDRLGLARATATSWPPRRPRPGGTPETYKRVLRPFRDCRLRRGLSAAVADCRRAACPASWSWSRASASRRPPAERSMWRRLARDAGFAPVVDLTDAYDGHRPGHAGDRPERLPSQRRRPRPARPPARPRRWTGSARAPAALDDPPPAGKRGQAVPDDHEPDRPASGPPTSASRRPSPSWSWGSSPGRSTGPAPRRCSRAPARPSSTGPTASRRRRLLRGPDRRRRRRGGAGELAMRPPGQAIRLGPVPRGQRLAPAPRPAPLSSSSSRTSTARSSASRSRPTAGLRDREYTLEKPPGVFRIAVLGSSIDMGWGVGTEDTYVSLLEDWLNATPPGAGWRGGSRCSTSPSPPTARCSGSRPSAARRWPSIPTWCSTRRPCSTTG